MLILNTKKEKISFFGYGFKQRLWVFLVNIAVIGTFFLVGRFFDYKYDKSPLWTFAAVIISFPFTQFFLYKTLIKK